jgi:hypothetical protein
LDKEEESGEVQLGRELFSAIEPSKEGEAELFAVLTSCELEEAKFSFEGRSSGSGENSFLPAGNISLGWAHLQTMIGTNLCE